MRSSRSANLALMFINATLTSRNYRSPGRHRPRISSLGTFDTARRNGPGLRNKFESTNENRCNLEYTEVGCARYGFEFACESPPAHNSGCARVIGIWEPLPPSHQMKKRKQMEFECGYLRNDFYSATARVRPRNFMFVVCPRQHYQRQRFILA